MSSYVTERVQDFFKDKNEWESFLQLDKHKDDIINDWFLKLKSKVIELANKSKPDDWGFITLSWHWDFRWFVKKYGENSLSLWQRGRGDGTDNYCLTIWANSNHFEKEKIFNLLQDSKYSLIQSTFDSIDEVCDISDECRFVEYGDYLFDDKSSTGRVDSDTLAWYANYKTDELAKQIVENVNKFIKNPEITRMFCEINEIAKKER